MEPISKNDISYLVVVNASEESRLWELIQDFGKRGCKNEDVLEVVRGLINDGTVLLTKPRINDFEDLTVSESLTAISSWEKLETNDIALYLTEKGEERWETDDWGITSERAGHLMFSNNNSVSRVK